ncbi:MAG: hypothetical protein JO345_18170 [Streptosporangiaceae bacterium]|nr:hypothetical protein [Streptosporangiaceae bacterium]
MTAVRSGRFRPAWSGCPGVAGLITTWRLAADAGPGDPLPAMLDALATVDGARVLLIDAGGSATAQCFGGVLASAARYRGVAGALVHGAVRDTGELAGLGFPAYSVGVYPARLRGRFALRDTRVTVRLPDGPVRDGDFVIADADGAVFVPAAGLPAAVQTARRIAAAGDALLSRLQDDARPGPDISGILP